MTQVASSESVLGAFDDVLVELPELSVRLFREAEAYRVSIRPRGGGEGVDAEVVLTTGSHHMQVYWYPTGVERQLGQVPVVWLIDEARWVARNAAFLKPPEEARGAETGRWNSDCIQCHATHGQPLWTDRDKIDTRAAEFGIACEACHGPGEAHAAENRSPGVRFGKHLSEGPDPSIVNPARLDPARSSQVCGQCHGIAVFDNNGPDRYRAIVGSIYRPGDDLTETRTPVDRTLDPSIRAALLEADPYFEVDRFWPDGMVRVSGREYLGLLGTTCHTEGEMSCISCHELHPSEGSPEALHAWADDQLAVGKDGDAACLDCHEDFAERQAEHSRHAPDSAGSRCQNCHMPHTTYGLLKAIRSHEIDSPSVDVAVRTGRPDACSLCHLDRPLSWTAEQLEAGWGLATEAELGPEWRGTAASILWLLKGDAAQRSLLAWHMGWAPALQASGQDWQPPLLAALLEDPYEATRLIAQRSLRRFEGLDLPDPDALQTEAQRSQARAAVVRSWAGSPGDGIPARSELLQGAQGLDVARLEALLEQQDRSRVSLKE